MVDKNQAMIDFLLTCDEIKNDPLFFNFGKVEDNAHQAITTSNDINLRQPYIDGSVQKRYTFNVDSFKSVAYNPVIPNLQDENVDDMAEVQKILDWVTECNDNNIYPDFGDKCVIDEMKVLTENPDCIGIDTTLNPPMAVYRISIQIDYIDYTKTLWK
jgi:hypothetical protein